MAIFFPADYGYISSSSHDRGVPASLSDITITDSGRYVSLLTKYDSSQVPYTGYLNTIECISKLEEILGEDYYYMYLVPQSEGIPNLVLERIISAKGMCPNLWALAENPHSPFTPCIILSSCKTVVTPYAIYQINNDDTLTSLQTGDSTVSWFARQYLYYPLIQNYSSQTDLSTMTTYRTGGYMSGSLTERRNVWISNPGVYTVFNAIFRLNPTPTEQTDDPYNPGGTTGPGGGTGTFDDTGDDIDIPSLPTLSAADTGFITLFNPSLSELRALANYMWGPLFDLNTFKKIFADPMDAILGLAIVPVAVPNGGSRAVTVGNISTGVNMTVAGAQYVEVDCGTLNVEEYWGAYMDYDPYTKCYIYLPYIGTHPISTDDVMGKSVHVVYHVDILSGACTAFIKCGSSVIYQFIGQVSSSIPITGNNFTNVINGVLQIAGSIGTMVATGGFSAPAAVAKAGLASAYQTGHLVTAGASMAQDVMSMKPQVEKSGGLSGTGGMLGVQVPYMILERPRQALPERQNDFMGYPSFITSTLGNLSGYTEVAAIHLENTPCTEKEADEIIQFLQGGVII